MPWNSGNVYTWTAGAGLAETAVFNLKLFPSSIGFFDFGFTMNLGLHAFLLRSLIVIRISSRAEIVILSFAFHPSIVIFGFVRNIRRKWLTRLNGLGGRANSGRLDLLNRCEIQSQLIGETCNFEYYLSWKYLNKETNLSQGACGRARGVAVLNNVLIIFLWRYFSFLSISGYESLTLGQLPSHSSRRALLHFHILQSMHKFGSSSLLLHFHTNHRWRFGDLIQNTWAVFFVRCYLALVEAGRSCGFLMEDWRLRVTGFWTRFKVRCWNLVPGRQILTSNIETGGRSHYSVSIECIDGVRSQWTKRDIRETKFATGRGEPWDLGSNSLRNHCECQGNNSAECEVGRK